MTKLITRTLLDHEYPAVNWLPSVLVDAISWLQSYLDSIPEKYKDTASVYIRKELCDDDDYVMRMVIEYQMPEADLTREMYEAEKAETLRRFGLRLA